MRRTFLLSAAVVLLLSCGAFAAMAQMQGFEVDAANRVMRVGGHGSAEGGNMIVVGPQRQFDAWRGGVAMQSEEAVLAQGASTVGACGSAGVRQNASMDASQGQHVGGWRAGRQMGGQSLDLSLGTRAYKSGGIGSAVGAQGAVGSQNQAAFTPRGSSAASQSVAVGQLAAVSGGPCSHVEVNNSVEVGMTQSHAVTGRRHHPRPHPHCDP